MTKTSLFTCIIKTSGIYPKTSCKTNNKKQTNKQTLSAPPLAEEEVPEGSGGGGAAVLSKSSSAPVEKARQFDIDWCVWGREWWPPPMQTRLQLEGLCPQAWDTCSSGKRASLPVDLHNYLKKQLARNDFLLIWVVYSATLVALNVHEMSIFTATPCILQTHYC